MTADPHPTPHHPVPPCSPLEVNEKILYSELTLPEGVALLEKARTGDAPATRPIRPGVLIGAGDGLTVRPPAPSPAQNSSLPIIKIQKK